MSTSYPPDDNVAWKVWVGSTISVALATVAVVLRLIARKISTTKFWWDDYTIIIALAVHWGMGISRWIILICWHYGHHTVYVGPENLMKFQKAFVGIQTLYNLNAVVTKISLLLLYYRIFGVVKQFRWALWATAAVCVACWIPMTILAFLGCIPFERNWDKKIPGSCVNLVTFFRWNGILNLLIDFLILLLPFPMVWRLSMPVRQKLELSGIFLVGFFVCIVSILRVLAYKPHQLRDTTYSGADSMTWSQVEQGVGVFVACLPTLRPLLTCVYPRSKQQKSGQSSSGIGMDNFHSSTARSEVGSGMKTPWKMTPDSESTVGFARLQDDETVMSPADVQRSAFGSIGTAVTTSAAKDRPRETTTTIPEGHIMLEKDIDQRSEKM